MTDFNRRQVLAGAAVLAGSGTSKRAFDALMTRVKIDIAAVERAVRSA